MSAPYFTPDQDWLSDCCGAVSLFELFHWQEIAKGGHSVEMATGICSKCKDHANFTHNDDEAK